MDKNLYHVKVTNTITGKMEQYQSFFPYGILFSRTIGLIRHFNDELIYWENKEKEAIKNKHKNEKGWIEWENRGLYKEKCRSRYEYLKNEIKRQFQAGINKTFRVDDYMITFTVKGDFQNEK